MSEKYVSDDIVLPIVRRPILPDNTLSHLKAVEFDTRVKNSKDTNNLTDLLRDVEKSKCDDYDQWLKKEEKVLDNMGDKGIERSIKTLNMKKKLNKVMRYLHIPFQFSCVKENEAFGAFMSEYLLNLHHSTMLIEENGFDPIQYDLYRGMKFSEFQLDMNTYARIRDENNQKDEKPKVWYKRMFKKVFRHKFA